MNSTSHIGAAGELYVCNYLMSQGLEVCRNVAASGPVDLVAFNPANGRMSAIDVKSLRTPYTKADGSFSFGQKVSRRDDGVWQIVWVHGEAAPRLPEGFWEALGMEGPD